MLLELDDKSRYSGRVELILGPMFSGKTTEMLRRLKRHQLANCSCRIVKYLKDTRFSNDQVSTHDRQMQEAIGATQIRDVMDKILDADVIAIDEGQFFNDIAESCEDLANMGKVVIVSALDGDYNRKRFKTILALCPMAEEVCKLNSVCTRCGADAPFSKRLTSNTEQEVIGGSEMYTALCRSCYLSTFECQSPPKCLKIARIELILGPVFSGKTSELLRRQNRHALAGRICKLIHYKKKAVDENHLIPLLSHSSQSITAETVSDVMDCLRDCQVVAIDDAQFFADVVTCAERLANMDKIVIVASLDGDFNRKEFNNEVLELYPLAEEITKLHAVCTECGVDASFSSSSTTDQASLLDRAYKAVCRKCYTATASHSICDSVSRMPLKNVNS
ncbi:hypothetical protein AB6A40_006262 [Gnathostoma spinigerum]|uniref:Thymidine kinase, cytosolic n=1 Tax=Gnathostoma spinigerum TaxID=75299 RepID=A0ABD6EHW2_9BILA